MEAISNDHCIMISLFWHLHGGSRGAIGGEFKDGILWVVLFHGVEVICAFEKVGALARCVFRANGLAVNALCGEAL